MVNFKFYNKKKVNVLFTLTDYIALLNELLFKNLALQHFVL